MQREEEVRAFADDILMWLLGWAAGCKTLPHDPRLGRKRARGKEVAESPFCWERIQAVFRNGP